MRVIIILQVYHFTGHTVCLKHNIIHQAYHTRMPSTQTSVRKKNWHGNVRSHKTINKYFMLALLCSFPIFSELLVLVLIFCCKHQCRIVSVAKALLTSLYARCVRLMPLDQTEHKGKKAHNQVWRYPLRLQGGKQFCWLLLLMPLLFFVLT